MGVLYSEVRPYPSITLEVLVNALQALRHALSEEPVERLGVEGLLQLSAQPVGHHVREAADHAHQLLLPGGEAGGGGVALGLGEEHGAEDSGLQQLQDLAGKPFGCWKPLKEKETAL